MGSRTMSGLNSVCFLSSIVLVSCLLRLSASAKVEWKINLGGEPTDGFQAEEAVLNVDENFAKMRYHGQIKGTGTDLNVFKTQRFSRGEDLILNFPVPDGVYTVTLMFAETWKGAYGSGNRVFDVYLGSKPGGIVKVIDQMDPFRSGGPAGPVRRKFSGIATQGGLTLALRPIKQNPQIAGIVISGYSYGNAFMEDLPTVPAGPFEGGDFGSLSSIGPRTPADASLLYDPSLNPKLRASNKLPPSGNTPSQSFTAPAQNSNPTSTSETSTQPAFPNPFGTSPGTPGSQNTQGFQNTQGLQGTQGTNTGSAVTPGLPSPYSNTAYRGVGAMGTGAPTGVQSSQPQAVGRPAPVAVGSEPIGAPQGPAQYRSFRRRLASYYGEGAPVSFPFAPKGNVADNDALPLQAPGGQAYSDPVERISPMLNQGDQSVAVNDISHTQMSPPQDAAIHTPTNVEGGRGNLGELSPPSTGETMRQNPLETESSRTRTSLELSGEQEQASVQKEASSQHQMPPPLDLQTDVNPRDVQEHFATSFTHGEGRQSEAMSRRTERNMENSQEHAFPERGSGQFAKSNSRDVPDITSGAQVQDRREFESGTSDLQSPPSIRRQDGIRDEYYSSREKGSLGQNRSPTDFMHGIRNQIQSLIQRSKSSDPSLEDPVDYSVTPRDATTTSRTHHPQETKRTFSPVVRVSHGSAFSSSGNALERNIENQVASNSFHGRSARLTSLRETRSPQPGNADDLGGKLEADLVADSHTKPRSAGIFGERSYGQLRTPRTLNSISARQAEEDIPGLPGISGTSGSEDPSYIPEVPPAAGVHIGSGVLDGICIDNSTHCSCGMSNGDPKECLYVAKEDEESMFCVRRPCNGKLVCACAPGASSLCERSIVRDILVAGTVHRHGDNEESEIIPCRREILEHGINVLTAVA